MGNITTEDLANAGIGAYYWANRLTSGISSFVSIPTDGIDPTDTAEFQINTREDNETLLTAETKYPLFRSVYTTSLITDPIEGKPVLAAIDAGLLGIRLWKLSNYQPLYTTIPSSVTTIDLESHLGDDDETETGKTDPVPVLPTAILAPAVITANQRALAWTELTNARYGILRAADLNVFPDNAWARRGVVAGLGASLCLGENLLNNHEDKAEQKIWRGRSLLSCGVSTTEGLLYSHSPFLVGTGNLALGYNIFTALEQKSLDNIMNNPDTEPDEDIAKIHKTTNTLSFVAHGLMGAGTGMQLYSSDEPLWKPLTLSGAVLAAGWVEALSGASEHPEQRMHALENTGLAVAGTGVGYFVISPALRWVEKKLDISALEPSNSMEDRNIRVALQQTPDGQGAAIGISGTW